MTRQDDLPAGWLTQFRRGMLSGAGLLLLAVAGCAIPSFAVWLVPGSDSSPASSAVKSGALLALAAAHGGIRLNGQSVTLVPLLITGLLGWLIAAQARRSDSWSSVVGLTTGYGLAAGLLAHWASLGGTRAPAMASALAGAGFAGVLAGCGYGGSELVRRLADRQRRIARAAGAVLCCYLGGGALLVAGSLLLHLSTAIALQRQLAPGVAGLPILLFGIGLAPNAALAGAGYLAGPGFAVGSHTQISALASHRGTLPSFPLLAAVPAGRPAIAVGLLAIAGVALLAGRLCVRLTRLAEAAWPDRLADLMLASLLAGGALALLTALGSGGIGSGALGSIGARWWAVGGATWLLVLAASAAWLAVELVWQSTAVTERTAPIERKAATERTATDGKAADRPAASSATEPARARLRAVAGPTGRAETRRQPPADRSRNVG
jgi:Family of unknown function (DUF6350)